MRFQLVSFAQAGARAACWLVAQVLALVRVGCRLVARVLGLARVQLRKASLRSPLAMSRSAGSPAPWGLGGHW